MNALGKNHSDLAGHGKVHAGAMGTVYTCLPSRLASALGWLGHP